MDKSRSNQVRATHFVETVEGGTSQQVRIWEERDQGHLHSGDQREGQVRMWKENNQVRGTYEPKTWMAEGRTTSQDTKRKCLCC